MHHKCGKYLVFIDQIRGSFRGEGPGGGGGALEIFLKLCKQTVKVKK